LHFLKFYKRANIVFQLRKDNFLSLISAKGLEGTTRRVSQPFKRVLGSTPLLLKPLFRKAFIKMFERRNLFRGILFLGEGSLFLKQRALFQTE
jgi:hypothetical protein